MLIILFFILALLGIILFKMLIPYLLLGYMVFDGFSSRDFIHNFRITVGSINIYFSDLLYAATALLAVFGLISIFAGKSHGKLSKPTTITLVLVICYVLFFFVKLVSGYLDQVPLDFLIRRFSNDTQCLYLFIPLCFVKKEKQLKSLLMFVILVSLLFPFGQPFLFGSADQVMLLKGQGTLRLGFGDANLFLALGTLAFFSWQRKTWLSAIPLAGIAMLTHRSAYIAITMAIVSVSFLRKKKAKTLVIMGFAGVVAIIILIGIEKTTDMPIFEKTMGRFSETFETTGTTKARLGILPLAIDEFVQRPLTGLSYYEINKLQKLEEVSVKAFNIMHPHNFLLTAVMRFGTIGTALLLSIIMMLFVGTYKLSRRVETSKVGAYLFSSILFFVLFALMNTTFSSAGYVFWLLAGVTLWYQNQAHYLERQERKRKS